MARVSEIVKIINQLVAETEEGDLSWEAGENAGSYTTRSSRFVYVIASRDADDLAPWVFNLFKREASGELGVSLAKYTSSSSSPGDALGALRDLYDRAKLSANGLGSSLLDEVLKEFND